MHLNQFLNLMGPSRDNTQSRRIMLAYRAGHPYSTLRSSEHGKKRISEFNLMINTVVSAVSQ